MTLIDLSHPIEDGMAAYPGLPPVRIFAILDHDASRERYEGKAEFLLGGAELAGNTGTYLDAPFHRFREREDLARLPLETVAGLPGLVVDPDQGERYRSRASTNRPCANSRSWCARGGMRDGGRRSTGRARPSFPRRSSSASCARRCSSSGSTSGTSTTRRILPARPHTGLLKAGIPIVENLRGLEQLPREGFVFSAPPIALVRCAAFPVRAFAQLE